MSDPVSYLCCVLCGVISWRRCSWLAANGWTRFPSVFLDGRSRKRSLEFGLDHDKEVTGFSRLYWHDVFLDLVFTLCGLSVALCGPNFSEVLRTQVLQFTLSVTFLFLGGGCAAGEGFVHENMETSDVYSARSWPT